MDTGSRRLVRFLDGGLDPEQAGDEALREMRTLHATTLAMLVVAGPVTALVWRVVGTWQAVAMLVGAALTIANLGVARRTQRVRPAAEIGIALFFAAITSGAVVTGGFHSPSHAWLLLVPLAAALLVDDRAAWRWAGVSALASLGLFALDRAGRSLPDFVDPGVKDGYGLMVHLSALAAVIGLIAAFAHGQRRLVRSLRESHARIRQLAHFDPVTDLPNRTYFQDRLRTAVSLAARHKRQVGLLFIDLDGFKQVNDSLGHAAGDQLLREVGRRLKASVRSTDAVSRELSSASRELSSASREPASDDGKGGVDAVSRLGGDEFTVLLTEIGEAANAELVAERILRALREPAELGGQQVCTLASIGIALYPEDGRDADDLLRCADLAMYEAKSRGRDNFQFFSRELNAVSEQHARLEQNLRRAVGQDAFVVGYQPVRSIASGRMVRAEVRLSWSDPELARLSPGELVALAEAAGLLRGLWERVFRASCARLRAWQDAGLRPVPLCHDLSPRQFRSQELVRTVQDVLRETGVAPALLEFELPEAVATSRDLTTVESFAGLESLGVSFALDAFGTGLSSVIHLSRCPARRLKIDASLVRSLREGEDGRLLVRAIVGIAHHLRMAVAAEGVESELELAGLRELGCDEIQGPLVGVPLPAADFERLLPRDKDAEA